MSSQKILLIQWGGYHLCYHTDVMSVRWSTVSCQSQDGTADPTLILFSSEAQFISVDTHSDTNRKPHVCQFKILKLVSGVWCATSATTITDSIFSFRPYKFTPTHYTLPDTIFYTANNSMHCLESIFHDRMWLWSPWLPDLNPCALYL